MEQAKIINQLLTMCWKAMKEYVVNIPKTDDDFKNLVDDVSGTMEGLAKSDIGTLEQRFAFDVLLAFEKYINERAKNG